TNESFSILIPAIERLIVNRARYEAGQSLNPADAMNCELSCFVDEIQLTLSTELVMSDSMTTIRKTQQTTSVYENLRRRLTHGQLAAGSRLVEEKWAEHLQVNRSALREALNMLAHEGLLETGPKGGFFVPTPSQEATDEILEVRLAIEVGALQILELRQAVPAEGLAQLQQICDLMQQLLESGFEYGFTEADRKFHEVLVGMAGNSRLSRVYQHAPLPINPLPEIDAAGRHENMCQTLGEHRELFRLLQNGNIREATDLLRRHLLVDHGDPVGGMSNAVEARAPSEVVD
ncbi:MAG: Transcriptional regulator, GntR family, partial [Planctomycetaceae bacterium]|nr:Transcriptional regulator, GntR family [Planctomycetaceae bacterium]